MTNTTASKKAVPAPKSLPHKAGLRRNGKPSARHKRAWGKGLLIAAVSICLATFLGTVAVYRAVHGGGILHRWAAGLYSIYKQKKQAQAAAEIARKSPVERAENAQVLYRHGLSSGWSDWSWATHDLKKNDDAGAGIVLSLLPADNKGVYLHRDTPFMLGGYGSLHFWVRHKAPLNIHLVGPGGQFGPSVPMQQYLTPPTQATGSSLPTDWEQVDIPFADLGAVPGGSVGEAITGLVFQAAGAQASPEVLLNNITFEPDQTLPVAPATATVSVSVDAQAEQHAISPLIYGMAFAPEAYLNDLQLGLNRWGGNDKTRYNWVQGNAVNAARDWRWANRFASGEKVTEGASSAADAFVRHNRAASVETLLTVPSIGWVARNTDNNCTSQNVPGQSGDPLPGTEADAGKIAGYDATANRLRTSVRSGPRKGRPFVDSPPADSAVVFQDEWVNHLKNTFGSARTSGGVRFYAIDNEPDLWASTHTDVHPARPGYDEILARFVSYASAVKDVDPAAQITGPVSWGWTGYLYSALDQGSDNYHTHADRTKHGDVPFIPWFLGRVAQQDRQQGRRSLDVLDVHFYPQNGLYSQAVEPEAQAKRLRSTRALWDPDYKDESWIGEPVRLVPRLKEWIAGNYPGTKIGITEWNFGADQHINGALAIVDVLGIFGREDVYLANYWAYPNKDSPGYLAFKLLRHPDPVRSDQFGDVSIRAASQDDYRLGCYAALDTKQQTVTLLLVNKMPHTRLNVPVSLAHLEAGTQARTYLLSADDDTGKKARLTPGNDPVRMERAQGTSTLSVTLPPASALLVCLPVQKAVPQAASAKAKGR